MHLYILSGSSLLLNHQSCRRAEPYRISRGVKTYVPSVHKAQQHICQCTKCGVHVTNQGFEVSRCIIAQASSA
jgi:hypothetical protein